MVSHCTWQWCMTVSLPRPCHHLNICIRRSNHSSGFSLIISSDHVSPPNISSLHSSHSFIFILHPWPLDRCIFLLPSKYTTKVALNSPAFSETNCKFCHQPLAKRLCLTLACLHSQPILKKEKIRVRLFPILLTLIHNISLFLFQFPNSVIFLFKTHIIVLYCFLIYIHIDLYPSVQCFITFLRLFTVPRWMSTPKSISKSKAHPVFLDRDQAVSSSLLDFKSNSNLRKAPQISICPLLVPVPAVTKAACTSSRVISQPHAKSHDALK